MSDGISWNICRGKATSAVCKVMYRPWLTTLAPIFISFSRKLVRDYGSASRGHRQVSHEVAEVVGQRMELKANRVGSEGTRRVHLIAAFTSLIHCSAVAVPRWL
jgi:hypothetical protein